jgi:hypothetical protein
MSHLITSLKDNDLHDYPLQFQPLSIPSVILYLDNSVLCWEVLVVILM